MTYHRDIAKVARAELGWEDHGIFTATITYDGGSWGQTAPGYALGGEFGIEYLKAVLNAHGVDEWGKLKGRTVFVLRENERGPIVGVEPLPTEQGRRIVFSQIVGAE